MTLLLSAALRTLLLAVVCGGAALFLPRPAQALRLWRALLYAGLAMPLLLATVPGIGLPILKPAPAAAVAMTPAAATAAPRSRGATPVENAGRAAATVAAPAPTQFAAGVHRSLDLAWLLYAAGALVLGLRLALGVWFSWRLRRRSAAAVAGGQRVLVSGAINVPLTAGLLRPAIVLPARWTEWDTARLAAVLAHEGAHRERGDTRTQFAARLHRAVFWFSPLSWWLVRHLEELAERASDEAALAAGAEPADYAGTLLAFFSRLAAEPERAWWRGVAMARGGSPLQRIDRILAWKKGTTMTTPTRTARFALSTLMLAAITLAAAVRPVARFQDPAPALLAAQLPMPPSWPQAAAPPTTAVPVETPQAVPAPSLPPAAPPAPAVSRIYAFTFNDALAWAGDGDAVMRVLPDGQFTLVGQDTARNAYFLVAKAAAYTVQFDAKFDGSKRLDLDFRGWTAPQALDSIARASNSAWKMKNATTVLVTPLPQAAQNPPLPTFHFNADASVGAPASRLLVLYFDLTTMPPADAQSAVASAETWVNKQMQPTDKVAIAVLSNSLQVAQDFTADKDVLRRDLEAVGASGTTNADNADRSLQALATLAQMLAPVEGKKSVLYFSDGITRNGTNSELTLRTAIDAAVKANVAFYAVDARGLMQQLPSPPPSPSPQSPGEDPPIVVSRVDPDMPSPGLAAGQIRTVNVDITIGSDGRVTGATAEDSPQDDFDKNAVAAVMKWVFQPAKWQGTPVAVSAVVQVRFHN